MILPFQLRNLRLNLGFELIRRSSELIQHFADLPSDLRQLLWPKDDQGKKKQENRLRKAHANHHTAAK